MRTALATLVLAGCACAVSQVASDAGEGAPSLDAARDGARDAAREAAGDASDASASSIAWGSGTCTTYSAGDPGWVPFDWFHAGCVERASRPDRLFGQLCWQPCRDGHPGCSELILPGREDVGLGAYGVGAHDGVHGYVSLGVGPPPGISVLLRDDGVATSAWRNRTWARPDPGPDNCNADLYVGPTHAALFLLAFTQPIDIPLLYAPIVDIGAQEMPLTTITGAPWDPTFGSVSDQFVSIDYGLSGLVTRTSTVGVTETVSSRTATSYGFAPVVVADQILFTERGTVPGRIMIAHADLSTEVLRQNDADIRLLGADERDIVWWEGREPVGDGYARLEIFRAAFTTDPAALVAERVVRVPGIWTFDGVLGFGHFLYYEDRGVHDVDLATGAVYEAPQPADERFAGLPAYSGPDDFMLAIERAPHTPSTAPWPSTTLLRFRHDSLGAPIPVEGVAPCADGGTSCELDVCPPRLDCSTFESWRGWSCASGLLCLCTGSDQCVWECDSATSTFVPSSSYPSCAASGITPSFP